MSLIADNIQFTHGSRFSLEVDSLQLEPGKLTALVGPNGSGKTTLIRLLAGFLIPESGSVKLFDRSVREWSDLDRARHIAYVSQTWRPSFPFTVEQTILMGRTPWRKRLSGFDTESDLEMADKAISDMDLEKFRNEAVTELSGGELQRVMLATALAQESDFLLLDEPTTHLDIKHQQSTLESLKRATTSKSIGTLASIHDLNLASIYADSVVLMQDGRVVAQGAPAEVLERERLTDLFGVQLQVEANKYGEAPGISYTLRESGAISDND